VNRTDDHGKRSQPNHETKTTRASIVTPQPPRQEDGYGQRHEYQGRDRRSAEYAGNGPKDEPSCITARPH